MDNISVLNTKQNLLCYHNINNHKTINNHFSAPSVQVFVLLRRQSRVSEKISRCASV